MKNNELFRHIGDLSQIAGIKHFEFKSGKAKGVEAFEVRTGAGLSYTVLKDRALDIAWAEYKSEPFGHVANVGIASPVFFEPEGLGFFRNFTPGFLTTCGLTYCGAPGMDQGKPLGLHGRIGNTPAEEVGYETLREQGNEHISFVIKGKVREAAYFNENLVLERQIRSEFGVNKIFLHNRISNWGYEPQPLMMLFHFNFGYPLVQETAEIIAPIKTVTPRDSRAAEGIARHLIIEPPQPAFAEQVYYLDLAAEKSGNTQIAIINRSLGFGVYEKFNKRQLPRLIQWKQMGEGYYVMGIEPGNCFPEGRAKERERGTLEYIKPGETRDFDLEIGILENDKAIHQFLEQTKNML